MDSLRENIRALAEMMDEFGLAEAKLKLDGETIEFSRYRPSAPAPAAPAAPTNGDAPVAAPISTKPVATAPAAPAGTPITSPMMGVFYSCPTPGSPPFVKEGDTVTAGQVIGLIEAMKVFNEITAEISGKVLSVPAKNGALVQAGDTLILIGR